MRPLRGNHIAKTIMNCAKCTKTFDITREDHEFYVKIAVPAPTFCPDCRRQRRHCFRNERALYSRPCDLCQKATVSLYSPAYPGPVYCQSCWWSDGWDVFRFGRTYDPQKSFFDQLKDLFLAVPQIAIFNTNSENSEFTAHSSRNKNCYMAISALTNEDSYYVFQATDCTDACDGAFTRNSSKTYETIDCETMYNCAWCQGSSNCTDSRFLYDCHGCTNCFMSVNLKNKEYYFKNEKCSPDQYKERVRQAGLASHKSVAALKKEFADFVRLRAAHRYSSQMKCEDSTGNYLLNCANAKECFDARNLEDCKYMVVSPGPSKDSQDVNYTVFGSELLYDVLSTVDQCISQQFCQYSWGSSFLQYCSYVMNSDNCFGSCGLRKAKFCILNKQYTESEYVKLRAQIIEDMKVRGEYGQFFSPSLSAFGYNETIANDEWPLIKEEAVKQGFTWQDATSGRYDPPTREWGDVPDNISALDESICREMLACDVCKRNFKILKQELEFYKTMNVPLPRRCFDCRHMARMAQRNPRQLWTRQCLCDQPGHNHAGQCTNTFETTYAPERPEIIYCETCYQHEIV